MKKIIVGTGVLSLVAWLFCISPASAAKTDCVTCHEDLIKKKVVHAAVSMGCETCHSGIDASDIPHKKTTKTEKGLSSPQPDICYGCHDKKMFTRKHVHAAVMTGCTTCHNPHSSPNQKLLTAEMPDLCYTCHNRSGFTGEVIHAPIGVGLCSTCHLPHSSEKEKLLIKDPPELCFSCHDKAEFSKKNVHTPVQGGMCLSCHQPHVSEWNGLLNKEGNDICFECHAEVRKSPHAIAGFATIGHPLGGVRMVKDKKTGKREKKSTNDPVRPGKIFYCGSCHNPHSSDSPKLFRYKADRSMGLCIYCHEK